MAGYLLALLWVDHQLQLLASGYFAFPDSTAGLEVAAGLLPGNMKCDFSGPFPHLSA
jgi:hypothetical protein